MSTEKDEGKAEHRNHRRRSRSREKDDSKAVRRRASQTPSVCGCPCQKQPNRHLGPMGSNVTRRKCPLCGHRSVEGGQGVPIEDAQSSGHSLLGYYALGARLIACASYNWKIRVLCSEETFSNQPPLHLRQAFVCDDVIRKCHSFGLGERK